MRAGYTLIAWFVLVNGIEPRSFFGSVFLFVIPMALDAFKSLCLVGGLLLRFEFFFTLFWCCVSVLGLLGILVVVQDSNSLFYVTTSNKFAGFYLTPIDIQLFWGFLGGICLLSVIDVFCAPRI